MIKYINIYSSNTIKKRRIRKILSNLKDISNYSYIYTLLALIAFIIIDDGTIKCCSFIAVHLMVIVGIVTDLIYDYLKRKYYGKERV